MTFADELMDFIEPRLVPIVNLGGEPSSLDRVADSQKLLQVALANEINVSELAAVWMPSTAEIDVKLAFARQAGDEAGHFMLVSDRLTALGFDVAGFQPAANPMFEYLRGLESTAERIATGLFTLELIAYQVNENFMGLCTTRGDTETVRIYRDYIQPDERAHQQLGQKLLAKYATSPDEQQRARVAVRKLLELAIKARAYGTAALGTRCFPGC